MKPLIPILALVLLATSCTTAYKSGHTPDDVYYSPAPVRTAGDYVQLNREEDRSYRTSRPSNSDYVEDYAYSDDRYLRMKVRNRYRWSDLDYYYSDPYAFGNYNRFYGSNYWSPYSYWNSYANWNFYYNPYYQPFYNPYYLPYGNVVVVNPKSPVYSRPRTYNLNTFNRSVTSPSYNQPRRATTRYQTFDDRPFQNSNANNTGSEMRRSFGNSNNNSSTTTTPSRSSSSGSSSSGSSGSRPAPVRKF